MDDSLAGASAHRPLSICIVTSEFLGCGPTGGHGVGARVLARHLVGRGHRVQVIVPNRMSAETPSELDGATMRSYRMFDLAAFVRLIREADAEVYHHVQASIGAELARRALPDRVHVVECVDPRDKADWLTEFRLPTHSAPRLVPAYVYFGSWLAGLSARRADVVQVPARFLQAKARRIYDLATDPVFMPMPQAVATAVEKAREPTVVFVGRLVRRKRPEVVLEVARHFPDVQFAIIGGGGGDHAHRLRACGSELPNVTFTEFIDQASDDSLCKRLSSAWILINAAAREGLPLAFIEAAAHGCAILSCNDPDGYATSFGHCVRDNDYARGLRCLLDGERWREAGERGRAHVGAVHAPDEAIDRQIKLYRTALDRRSRSAVLATLTPSTRS